MKRDEMTKSIDIRTSDRFVCPSPRDINAIPIRREWVHPMKSESAYMFRDVSNPYVIMSNWRRHDNETTADRLNIMFFLSPRGKTDRHATDCDPCVIEAWKWDFTLLSFTERSHSIWSRVEHNTTTVSLPCREFIRCFSPSSLFLSNDQPLSKSLSVSHKECWVKCREFDSMSEQWMKMAMFSA